MKSVRHTNNKRSIHGLENLLLSEMPEDIDEFGKKRKLIQDYKIYL